MRWTLLFLAILAGIFAACSPPLPTAIPTAGITAQLIPFLTTTPTSTQLSPTRVPEIEITVTPVPSPTPLTHTIKDGDTMLGLALQYRIALEELKAANPAVDPRAMTVGTVLIIPLQGEIATPAPSQTPVPLTLINPQCYPERNGGAWCAVLVQNDQDVAYESLSAWIGLFTADGTLLVEKTAIAPLNLIKPGESVSLTVNFPGPIPEMYIPQARLTGALPVSTDSSRYLEVTLQVEKVEIDVGGKLAHVTGQVSWSDQQPVPGSLGVAITAVDRSGQVVGVRKVDLISPCNGGVAGENIPTPGETALLTCTAASFETFVYSQGPAIDRILASVEARP